MTPLAILGLLYILHLPFKKKKVETMIEFLELVDKLDIINQSKYALLKEERHKA